MSEYIEVLQSKGQYSFLRTEAMLALGCTENAYKKAMHRLVQKDRMNRVRGDFYTIVPLEYRASGTLPASWFIDALMQYLEQPYYCSLLTSATLLGASHQQPMIFQVVTHKPTRSIHVGSVRIEFVCKKRIRSHYYQTIKTPTGFMKVATPEMTAYDLLRYMQASGHIHHVSTVLSELAPQIDSEKLSILLEEGDVEVTTAQRLGYLLDFLGLPIELEPLERALKRKKPIRRLLVTGLERPVIEYSQRWHILVNERVEPDEV